MSEPVQILSSGLTQALAFIVVALALVCSWLAFRLLAEKDARRKDAAGRATTDREEAMGLTIEERDRRITNLEAALKVVRAEKDKAAADHIEELKRNRDEMNAIIREVVSATTEAADSMRGLTEAMDRAKGKGGDDGPKRRS